MSLSVSHTTRRPAPWSWMFVLAVAGLSALSAASRGGARADEPVALAVASSGDRFDAALAPMMSATALTRATVGVQVVRVRDGEEVFAVNPDRPLLPASTTKLVTAATALDTLGPSYTFRTDVFAEGKIVGGVLQGNLYVRGGGDPTLVSERIWRMLRDLRGDGIAAVDGDIIFDEGFFDEGYLIPAWDSTTDLERGVTYFPPISALASDFGGLTLVVRPGAEVGQRAVVELATDAPDYVVIDNKAITGRSDSRTRISVSREVLDRTLQFEVSGTMALDASAQRHRKTVGDPTAYTMAVVKGLLDDVGVRVTGTFRRGEVPASGARLLRRVESPPLTSVLMDTNKYSSNFMAEMVLRTLGAEVHGSGTTSNGLKVVGAYLERLGVPRSDWKIANGSGLSRETRIAPSVLTAVLLDMAYNHRVGHEFISSLAIGGRDGTLVGRMRDLEGAVRGKTGTLGGVSGLAGYAEDADGERYAFAFLVNDVSGSMESVKAAQDDLLRALARVKAPSP